MIGFNSFLDTRQVGTYKGKVIYKLLNPLIFVLNDIKITVPMGVESDLASVPRLPFIYAIWGNRVHREAFLHDFLYRKDVACTKNDADWWFRLAMMSSSPEYNKVAQPYWIYQPMYLSVRAFSLPYYNIKTVDYKFPLD